MYPVALFLSLSIFTFYIHVLNNLGSPFVSLQSFRWLDLKVYLTCHVRTIYYIKIIGPLCMSVRPSVRACVRFSIGGRAPQARIGRCTGARNAYIAANQGAAGTSWEGFGRRKCLYSSKSGRRRHGLGGLRAQEMLIL